MKVWFIGTYGFPGIEVLLFNGNHKLIPIKRSYHSFLFECTAKGN